MIFFSSFTSISEYNTAGSFFGRASRGESLLQGEAKRYSRQPNRQSDRQLGGNSPEKPRSSLHPSKLSAYDHLRGPNASLEAQGGIARSVDEFGVIENERTSRFGIVQEVVELPRAGVFLFREEYQEEFGKRFDQVAFSQRERERERESFLFTVFVVCDVH